MLKPRWLASLRRHLRGFQAISLWHHELYRLPIPALESAVGFDTRRVDYAFWFLLDSASIPQKVVRRPSQASLEKVGLAHELDWFATLCEPEALARAFQLAPEEIPVQSILTTFRLACGGTIGAAHETLETGRPAVNMLGGFHHAAPRRAAGFCVVNDIAIALRTLRLGGLRGLVAILDLDAHPPDGLAEFFAHDESVWIGSISGSDWGHLPGVDETLLPEGSGDAPYRDALDALLDRVPECALAFVIAGGDVLAGDRLGRLGLTLEGAQRRDEMVAETLLDTPTVWLPGGGYSHDAWKVLAGTCLVLCYGRRRAIPPATDPLAGHYARIAQGLSDQELGAPGDLDLSDIEEALGVGSTTNRRILGFYSNEGIQIGLERLGYLDLIRRLGYRELRVETEAGELDDRLRILGRAEGREHLLVEGALARRHIGDTPSLFVNWITLRHPLAVFTEHRPRLPGQEVPGLGLLEETSQLLVRVAKRLELDALAFRPSRYHIAYLARRHFRFVDPLLEARFRALQRDLGDVPLSEMIAAFEEGRVLLDDQPFEWEPGDMVGWVREDAENGLELVEPPELDSRFSLLAATAGQTR